MTGDLYDVLVVGAGPAGSYAAYNLSSLGHKVAVLERKEAPGIEVCCTGIISPQCFDSFGITSDVILTQANSARFFSPSGRCLRLQAEKIQAYIVDRGLFDKALASKAQSQGAHYLFSSQVIDITPGVDGTQVETLCHGARRTFNTRVVILATGLKSKLPLKLGLGRIKRFLIGAQVEIEAKNIDEVEVYFAQQIAPGSLAWLVPTSADKALAGVLSPSQAKLHLQKFLLSPLCQGRIVSQSANIRQKVIPLGTLPRSYGDRILVIGDAAGQVKPITGGGIYYGHLGAKIATEVLDEALSSDDLAAASLSRYQKQWKAKMGREIFLDCWARRAYARLSGRQIERIFNVLDSGGLAKALLNSPSFSFDWHSRLILASLKYGLAHPLRKAWHLLPRRAGL